MREPDYLTRRHMLPILAGPAALVATGVALAPLSAEPSDADAELIDLCGKLDEAINAWRAFRTTYEAAMAAMEKRERRPEVRAAFAGLSGQDWDGWAAIYRRVHGADEKAIVHGNALLDAAARIADAIRARPPRTLAGLAVHARALAWGFAQAWDEPSDDLDWEPFCVRHLVETVCALAGVTPLPAESA